MAGKRKDSLKNRLEKDENWICKLGKQIGEAYAQFGDFYRMIREQQAQLEKIKSRLEKVEAKAHEHK